MRLGWTAIAAAACLVVVVWAYQHDRGVAPAASSSQDAPGGEQIGTSESLAEKLAVLWSQAREELAGMQFDDWVAGFSEDRDESDELLPPPREDEADEDAYDANTPPSWMPAAVRAVNQGPGAGGHGATSPKEN